MASRTHDAVFIKAPTVPAAFCLQLLDLGCGYGGTAVHITEQLKCKTIGINISPFQVGSMW